MKILTVVGARPQFIKAAAVSRVLRERHTEVLVHTGQHYDRTLSDLFFEELEIPAPDYDLEVGSASHAVQCGEMMIRLEKTVVKERPELVLVYGDTNSTLAGALVGAKLTIPVAHVEAGLRSLNRSMPEEINRVLTDQVSDFLFAPTSAAVTNLAREGIVNGVHLVGDVMCDVLRHNSAIAATRSTILKTLALKSGDYVLATIHRPSNTDDRERLGAILTALAASECDVVLPLHPRTRDRISEFGMHIFLRDCGRVRVIEPVGYFDMLALESNARVVLTDSGGVQKEAYMLGVPCVTVRSETEWVETVEAGWNTLVGDSLSRIPELLAATKSDLKPRPDVYGNGTAARQIRRILEQN